MSAAEPADPTRAYVNHARDADVIPLTKGRRRGAPSTSRGRDSMTSPSGPRRLPCHDPKQGGDIGQAGQDGPPGEPLAGLAESMEMSFLEIGRSLTEPDTASVFLRTLDILQRALEGSRATGIIDAVQLADLSQVIEGMRQAPRLV